MAGLLASVALLYAIFGRPPYAYFSFMKGLVAASSVFLALVLWRLNRATAPLVLVLIGLAGVETMAKTRRDDWVPWNWAMVATLLIGAVGTFTIPAWRPNDD